MAAFRRGRWHGDDLKGCVEKGVMVASNLGQCILIKPLVSQETHLENLQTFIELAHKNEIEVGAVYGASNYWKRHPSALVASHPSVL